jgi:antitoxin YobK
VSLEDYRSGRDLIEAHAEEADFEGERSEQLVEQAEAALGLAFPPSYRAFVRELGAGDIGGEEFYGIVDEDFENSGIPDAIWLTLGERGSSNLPDSLILVGATGDGSYFALDTARTDAAGEAPVVVWTPGASSPGEDLEQIASSFGSFFAEAISSAVSS